MRINIEANSMTRRAVDFLCATNIHSPRTVVLSCLGNLSPSGAPPPMVPAGLRVRAVSICIWWSGTVCVRAPTSTSLARPSGRPPIVIPIRSSFRRWVRWSAATLSSSFDFGGQWIWLGTPRRDRFRCGVFLCTPVSSLVACSARLVLIGRYNLPVRLSDEFGGETDIGSREVLLGVKDLGFSVVEVLTWVCSLVFECLDELVETAGEERAKDWANPVDPVVAVEGAEDDTRAKGAGRV